MNPSNWLRCSKQSEGLVTVNSCDEATLLKGCDQFSKKEMPTAASPICTNKRTKTNRMLTEGTSPQEFHHCIASKPLPGFEELLCCYCILCFRFFFLLLEQSNAKSRYFTRERRDSVSISRLEKKVYTHSALVPLDRPVLIFFLVALEMHWTVIRVEAVLWRTSPFATCVAGRRLFLPRARRHQKGTIVACCSLLLLIIIITSCIIASTSYLSSWGVQALCVIYLICKEFLKKSVSACHLSLFVSLLSPVFFQYLLRRVWSRCVVNHSSLFLWRVGGIWCSRIVAERLRQKPSSTMVLCPFLSYLSATVFHL